MDDKSDSRIRITLNVKYDVNDYITRTFNNVYISFMTT